MADQAPWLTLLNKYEAEGFKEIEGSDSNQKILDWSHGPGKYPQMDDDSTTPWCGIGLAGIFSEVKMPQAIPASPALAISWLNCGAPCEPKPGAVAVFPRTGGNHVTVIKNILENGQWECVGCNQSNAIKTSLYNADEARGTRWPRGAPGTIVISNAPKEIDPNSYAGMLQRMQVLPSWQAKIDSAARVIVNNKARYKKVAAQTGVPWAFIGALHYRESTNNFTKHLHNGDSLEERTSRVPAGRPAQGDPPFEWEYSAVDSLDYDGFVGKTDWSLVNICARAEKYNGMGYKNRGVPSPYLWSGTNLYTRGKFVEDGVFNSSVVDKQCGVIPVYLRSMDLAQEKIVRENSRKLKLLDWVRFGMKGLVAAGGALLTTVQGLFTGDSLGAFQTIFTTINGVFDVKLLLTLMLGGVGVWILVNWLDKLMMDDAKAGTWIPSGLMIPGADVDNIANATDVVEQPNAANVE